MAGNSMSKGGATVESRQDGIYLVLNQTDDGKSVSRTDVLDLIEEFGVKNVDFQVMNNLFKAEGQRVEAKIASAGESQTKSEAESVTVEIAKDKMGALISFKAPFNSSDLCTVASITLELERAGVKFGIIPGALEALVKKHDYKDKYLVAKGKPAIDGVNGYLKYHFDVDKKTRAPKELEDGRVDFRQLNLIEVTDKGRRLVTAVPPVEGADGYNVLGQILTARPGKPTPPLAKGKNVSDAPDGLGLIADVGGQIMFDGKRVSVSPALDIATDVDNGTGDIDFIGSVIIKGNVRTGFTVKATGNIEVYGVVEGAKLMTDESIFCYSGVQGNGKGEVMAGRDITLKFAESCELEAGGDIIAESIMHCTVKCGHSLTLSGRKGLLVGGKTQVGERLELKNLGTPMTTATEIEVGFDPSRLELYRAMTQEYNITLNEYTQLDKTVNTYVEIGKKSQLPEDKKFILLKLMHNRTALRDKLDKLQSKLDEMAPLLDSQTGMIVCSESVHPGVKIMIGNAVMYVHDQIWKSSFRNVDGKITISALV